MLFYFSNWSQVEMDFNRNVSPSIIVDFLMHHDAFYQPIQCGDIQFLNVSILGDGFLPLLGIISDLYFIRQLLAGRFNASLNLCLFLLGFLH